MYKKAVLWHQPPLLDLVMQITSSEFPPASFTAPASPDEESDISSGVLSPLSVSAAFQNCPVSEIPAITPETEEVNGVFSLPSLSSALELLDNSASDVQRPVLKQLLVFFTFSTPSANDWAALLGSGFFATVATLSVQAIDHRDPDHHLAVFCLNTGLFRALSAPQLESLPEISIAGAIMECSDSLLALFGTVAMEDECLDTYFAIGAEVIALTQCRDLADAILSSLNGAIVLLIQTSALLHVFPELWWLVHEWFLCGPLKGTDNSVFLCDYVLPAVFQLQNDVLPLLDFKLILVIGDVCAFIDGVTKYLIEQGLPRLLQEIVVTSTKKRLTRASFDVLYYFVGKMEEPPEINPACVDAVFNTLPDAADKIIDLALRAFRSDTTSAKRDEFWNQRAAWAASNFENSYVKTSVWLRCFVEGVNDPADLIDLVDYRRLIPRVSDFLLTDPSHEDRMRAIRLLVGCASINEPLVYARIQLCCNQDWFDEMHGMALAGGDREEQKAGHELEAALEELFCVLDAA
jgi:hypothetical protein